MFNVAVYHFKGLFAVESEVAESVRVHSDLVSKDDFDGLDVEVLVVYDQDTVRVVFGPVGPASRIRHAVEAFSGFRIWRWIGIHDSVFWRLKSAVFFSAGFKTI